MDLGIGEVKGLEAKHLVKALDVAEVEGLVEAKELEGDKDFVEVEDLEAHLRQGRKDRLSMKMIMM